MPIDGTGDRGLDQRPYNMMTKSRKQAKKTKRLGGDKAISVVDLVLSLWRCSMRYSEVERPHL